MDQKEIQQNPQDVALSRDAQAKMFGVSLRQSREAAGYSIERAAISTKISISFIQALEEGEFKQLPGLVFARGFIRNLCKIYQADAASFLDKFEKALGQPAPVAVDANESSASEGASQRVEEAHRTIVNKVDVQNAANQVLEKFQHQIANYREKLVVILPLLHTQRYQLIAGAALGAILVAVLTFFVTEPATQEPQQIAAQSKPSQMPVVVEEQPPAPQNVDEANAVVKEEAKPVIKDDARPVAKTVAKDEAAPTTVGAATGATASKVAESVANAPVPPLDAAKPAPAKIVAPKLEKAPVAVAASPIPVGARQTLEIVAREKVVVRLTKDGGAPQNLTLEPKQHAFEFRDEAQVLIFDASVVDVKYNGRSLGPLGKSGRVRRLSFKREELPAHAKM